MKALIYEKHDEIDLNFIVNLVRKIELNRHSKVNLVIVEVDLFRKLSEEGIKNGALSGWPGVAGQLWRRVSV